MKITVSDESRRAARGCTRKCACLERGGRDLCPVDYCAGNGDLFLKCASADACSYRHQFDGMAYCTCPVRKEIFNKYWT